VYNFPSEYVPAPPSPKQLESSFTRWSTLILSNLYDVHVRPFHVQPQLVLTPVRSIAKQQIILQVQLLQVLLEHLLHFAGIFIFFLDLLFLNKIYICFDIELNCFWRASIERFKIITFEFPAQIEKLCNVIIQ
jgi:hypothetical protein